MLVLSCAAARPRPDACVPPLGTSALTALLGVYAVKRSCARAVRPARAPARQALAVRSLAAPALRLGLRRKETPCRPSFAHHDVKDKKHWLASPKREEFSGRSG